MWPIVLRALALCTISLYMVSYKFISDDLPVASEQQIGAPSTAALSVESPIIAQRHFDAEAPADDDDDEDEDSRWPAVLRAVMPRLRRLDCIRLAASAPGDARPAQNALREGRITLIADPATEAELDMQCAALHARWHFRRVPGSKAEADFPLAFARTVYRDYMVLEQLLSVEYAPQNLYCYTLDSKSTPLFKQRMRALAACFPEMNNVMVAERELDVQSDGKNVTSAHLTCLEMLEAWSNNSEGNDDQQRKQNWKYALLLQNQDIPLRTNAELVEIMQAYGGANEVGTLRITPGTVNKKLNWTMDSLNLYRDGSHPWSPGAHLHHTKSLNLVALSRPSVQFLLHRLNLDTYIERLEQSHYGMDEVFMSSLNSNLAEFPGGFTWHCLEQHNQSVEGMGRFVIWSRGNGASEWNAEWGDRCQTGYYRHHVCIMGLEQLGLLSRVRLFFYANKMLPEFDYGAIHCWLNILTARRNADIESAAQSTNGLRALTALNRINTHFFANLPHVRFNRFRAHGRLSRFRC